MSSHNQPPAEEQLLETDGLEAEIFWHRHRATIIGAVLAVLVAGVVVAAWFINAYQTRLSAQAAFAEARNPEAWREVIARYPRTEQAANAYFLLAESLREQGDIPQSTGMYQKFLVDFPTHQLAGGARLGIAENLEVAGKTGEALTALKDVQVAASGSYAAQFAALLEGRIYLRQEKLEEARKVFSTLVSTYSQSPAARAAGAQLDEMAPLLPTAPVRTP